MKFALLVLLVLASPSCQIVAKPGEIEVRPDWGFTGLLVGPADAPEAEAASHGPKPQEVGSELATEPSQAAPPSIAPSSGTPDDALGAFAGYSEQPLPAELLDRLELLQALKVQELIERLRVLDAAEAPALPSPVEEPTSDASAETSSGESHRVQPDAHGTAAVPVWLISQVV